MLAVGFAVASLIFNLDPSKARAAAVRKASFLHRVIAPSVPGACH